MRHVETVRTNYVLYSCSKGCSNIGCTCCNLLVAEEVFASLCLVSILKDPALARTRNGLGGNQEWPLLLKETRKFAAWCTMASEPFWHQNWSGSGYSSVGNNALLNSLAKS